MKPLLIALAATALLPACAALGPSSEEIARLPVVDYGQTPPANGEFVLRYPAHTDLPVTARVGGNLLERNEQAELKVRLKQDVYLYRNRVSLDGKTWQASHERIGGRVTVAVPGERAGRLDARSPGELAAEFDLK